MSSATSPGGIPALTADTRAAIHAAFSAHRLDVAIESALDRLRPARDA